MTPLRFVLGLLWLAGASAWMLPLPCMNLWRAWGYRSARPGARNGNFAVMGAMKQLCFITSGIVAGLSAFWWEYSLLCLETAMTLLLLGVWLIYFEAPIDGLFDADDEEVLGDEEMLSLWYGGLNEIYVQARSRWGVDYSFSRTRAWFWDVPELRAAGYYFKAQFAAFLLVLLLLLLAAGEVYGARDCIKRIYLPYSYLYLRTEYMSKNMPNLCIRSITLFFVCAVFLPFAWTIRREWMVRYRELVRALKDGRDPDLSDRARLAEMRLAVLGWAREKSLVHYDRASGVWKLGSGTTQSEGGRLIG